MKPLRAFAAAITGPRGWISVSEIHMSATEVRISIGTLYAEGIGEKWRDGWKKAKTAGWRVIPVIVSPEPSVTEGQP